MINLLFSTQKSLKILYFIGLMIMALTTPCLADAKKLPLCPNTPNCVSSQAAPADSHFIAPFKLLVDPQQAWSALKLALLSQDRTVIIQETPDSLDAEATSLVFRFVDDIKVILDDDNKLIHIRSASRIGYGDFGVNRKRVEQLRAQLQQQKLIE